MSKALIIGAGGVAGVVIHKCCQNSEVFTEICIASRTKSKCDKFKDELQDKTSTKISTAQVDANNVDELVALINKEKPDIYNHGLVTIGENSVIPSGVQIGKNTAISGVTTPEDYKDGVLGGGETLIKAGERS